MENNILKNCKVMLFRSQAYRTLLHTGYSGWRLVFMDNHSAATWKDQSCVVQVTGNVSEHHREAVTSCVMGMQTQTDGGTSLRY